MKITMHAQSERPDTGIPTSGDGNLNGLNLGWLLALLQAKLQDGTADHVDISEVGSSISAQRVGDDPVYRRSIRAMVMFTVTDQFSPLEQTIGHRTWQQAREHAEQQMLYWQTVLDGIEHTMPRPSASSVRRVFWVQEQHMSSESSLGTSTSVNAGWYEHDGVVAPAVGDQIKLAWVAGQDLVHVITRVSGGMIQVARDYTKAPSE